MIDIRILQEKAKIWEVLDKLPDSAVIPAEMAEVYLDVHEKTLARLRQKRESGELNSGPPYIQHRTKAGTKARNQKVSYEMGDLRAYRASQKVGNTMEAAVLREMAFAALPDLLEPHPFWVRTIRSESRGGMGRATVSKSREVIVGHIQTVSYEQLSQLLADPDAEIQQLSLDHAMGMDWADEEARAPFHKAYTEVLQQAIDQSNRLQEGATLRKGSEHAR